MSPLRWNRCVNHRGEEATRFLSEFFSPKEDRRVFVIGGAGFDPRSVNVTRRLVEAAGADRVSGLFFREERANPAAELVRRAEANVTALRELVPTSTITSIEIFASDGAVVGGRRAVHEVAKASLDVVTDVIVDLSALSIGVAFPIVRYLLERTLSANVHVVVTDEPPTDLAITGTPSDTADTIAGFKGRFGLTEYDGAARLWLPQLVERRHSVLERIHAHLRPDDVCPILPFPAFDPRRADRLIAEYSSQFESAWDVDAHDIVYADEKNPLDLYRTVLRMDELRARVFQDTGGSLTILSPMGSKVLSIGILMAAIERDFPVVHVEAVAYTLEVPRLEEGRDTRGDLVHLWLHGGSRV